MQIKLLVDKEELEQKDTAKYLGFDFDKNLTCNKHILRRNTQNIE